MYLTHSLEIPMNDFETMKVGHARHNFGKLNDLGERGTRENEIAGSPA